MDKTLTNSEPAGVATLFVVFVNSLVQLLVLFGVSITTEQLAGINVALINAAAIAAWWFTRRKVYSPYTVQEAMRPSPEDVLHREAGESLLVVVIVCAFMLIIVLLLLGWG